MTIAFIIGGIVLAVICVSAFIEEYFTKKNITTKICMYLQNHQLLDRKRASSCYEEEKKAKIKAIIAPIVFVVILILVSLGTQNPFLVISFVITLMCLVFNVEEKTKPTVDSVYHELLYLQEDISHDEMNEFMDCPPSFVRGPSFEMLKEAYAQTLPRQKYLRDKKEEEKSRQLELRKQQLNIYDREIDDIIAAYENGEIAEDLYSQLMDRYYELAPELFQE